MLTKIGYIFMSAKCVRYSPINEIWADPSQAPGVDKSHPKRVPHIFSYKILYFIAKPWYVSKLTTEERVVSYNVGGRRTNTAMKLCGFLKKGFVKLHLGSTSNHPGNTFTI